VCVCVCGYVGREVIENHETEHSSFGLTHYVSAL